MPPVEPVWPPAAGVPVGCMAACDQQHAGNRQGAALWCMHASKLGLLRPCSAIQPTLTAPHGCVDSSLCNEGAREGICGHPAASLPGSVRGLVESLSSGALHLTPPACCTCRQHFLLFSWAGQLCHAGREVAGSVCALRAPVPLGKVGTLRWLLTVVKRCDALLYPQTRGQSLTESAQGRRGGERLLVEGRTGRGHTLHVLETCAPSRVWWLLRRERMAGRACARRRARQRRRR